MLALIAPDAPTTDCPRSFNPLRSLSLLVLAGLGLAGCAAVGPDYQAPTPAVPAGWYGIDTVTPPVTLAAAPGDLSQWWQRLNAPLLSDLINEALQANLDLRSAQARLREARARYGVAAAGRYPDVTASGSGRRIRSSEEVGSGTTQNLFAAGFDASWELDVFGGVRRSIEAAGADRDSAQASLEDTRVSLVAEVALNYVDALTLQIRLGIARDSLARQTETLQITEWRAQAGLVSSQDVEQARSSREQTRALIPSLQTSLAAAEHRLDLLLGRAPGSLHARLAAPADLPAAPGQVAVGIPADTVRQRPDVRAAERRLAAETARVGVAEAARYPAFNLSGSIGLEALTFAGLGDGGAGAASLFAGFTAPIFDGGRLKSQVELQDAVREQALVAYEQSVLSALQDVENALVAFARSIEREEALANAVEAARIAALLARQRYSTGLVDFQSVLDTERSMLVVEDSLASTRADSVLALISLYKALGGGWSPQTEHTDKDAS